MKKFLVLSTCCAAIFFNASRLHATSVVPPSFAELAEHSETIFFGEVLSKHSHQADPADPHTVWTTVSFQVLETYKGSAQSPFQLELFGGRVGDLQVKLLGLPRFTPGERVVLFVSGNGTRVCPILGLCHGKFIVRTEPDSGRDCVFTHDGTPLTAVAGRPENAPEGKVTRKHVSGNGNGTASSGAPIFLTTFKEQIQTALQPPSASKK